MIALRRFWALTSFLVAYAHDHDSTGPFSGSNGILSHPSKIKEDTYPIRQRKLPSGRTSFIENEPIINPVPPVPAPDLPSNFCPLASAIPIPYDPTGDNSVIGSTVGAMATLPDLNDGCSIDGNSATVWYRFRSRVDTTIDITTCSVNTDFDTVITVFVGYPETCNVVCIRRNDDHGTDLSQCSRREHSFAPRIDVLAKLTYYITVSGFDAKDEGLFELQIVSSNNDPSPTPNPTTRPTSTPTPPPTVCQDDLDVFSCPDFISGEFSCEDFNAVSVLCNHCNNAIGKCCACGGGTPGPTLGPTRGPGLGPNPPGFAPLPGLPPALSTLPTSNPTPNPTFNPMPNPTPNPTFNPTPNPTPNPTCGGVSFLFEDGIYETKQGRDESYTIECGGDNDIGIITMIQDGCNVECIGSITENVHEYFCEDSDEIEFSLDGDYEDLTLFIGYLDDDYDGSDWDCDGATLSIQCDFDATISTDRSTYDVEEEIEVYFEQCDPQPNDWIGVYDADANADYLGEFREDGQEDGHLWVYACSSHQDHEECLNQIVYEGDVEFDNDYEDQRGPSYWPLSPGRYKAHLIRASSGVYISIAESDTFEVVSTCDDDDVVSTNKDFYQYGEEVRTENQEERAPIIFSQHTKPIQKIRVSFEQCHPQPNDWIGIYEWNADPDDLGDSNGDGLLWLYACSGDQDHRECSNERLHDGTVEFDNGYRDERGPGRWPLERGWYRAHLVRASFEPYISIAESDYFEVF